MTLMRRVFIIPPVAILAFAAGLLGRTSSASPATIFSITRAGTDARTLDTHVQPLFVAGGGMKGVFEAPDTPITYKYFELGLNLPVGAKVTSAVSGKACQQGGAPVVFGSYAPATGHTLQNATMTVPAGCTLKTVTKTGNPITTTVAGRRYTIDFTPITLGVYPGTSNQDARFGATVKYTCASPCVP